MENTVEVYRRNNHNGHLRLVTTFNSLEELVDATGSFENFSCCDTDRCRYNLHRWDADFHKTIFDHPARTWLLDTTTFCYVVYNANGKIVPPDVLIGIDRRIRRDRWYRWHSRWNPGRKRKNGHWYRHPQTTNERRWAHAWDDEEFAPRVRAKRNYRHLPDAWDDYPRSDHGKNWKNYRKHQWKD